MDCSTDENRERAIAAAVDAVKAGWLVVVPIGTVYGLGCDAFDNQTVTSLLRAKHRGPNMPILVLVGSWSTTEGPVREYSPAVRTLVEAFWPSGLSLVVNQAPSLPWNLGGTANVVMLCMPLHPVAIEIPHCTGPMAMSSANVSGRASATSAVRAKQVLGGEAAVYVDGGGATIGTPLTIVDISAPVLWILYEDAVSATAVAEVLNTTPERLLGQ